MKKLFGKCRKSEEPVSNRFAESEWTPAIRTGICTGEMVAGFIEKASGKFHEIELVRNDADIDSFCRKYDVCSENIKRIY